MNKKRETKRIEWVSEWMQREGKSNEQQQLIVRKERNFKNTSVKK